MVKKPGLTGQETKKVMGKELKMEMLRELGKCVSMQQAHHTRK